MLYFVNDYSEGAHEKILKKLQETNMEKLEGYGNDEYTKRAKKKISIACGCPEADVWLLCGGTQTNQIIISSMLKNYQGVIAAPTGHINVHEAGAIEFTGHKVLETEGENGKITAWGLRSYLENFYADENREHMVQPGMVYITHPTEYGTLYSQQELEEISEICKEYNLTLYIDGARMAYALACPDNDLFLPDIARLCDVFYIGGTKAGALCGEAVVFTKSNTPEHFMTTIKQHGALLAKGRLLGIQFYTLFTDRLYLQIAGNAIAAAAILRMAFEEKQYRFFIDSPTNQLFIILDNNKMNELRENVKFDYWQKYDEEHTVVRFATSWATEMSDVEDLIALL